MTPAALLALALACAPGVHSSTMLAVVHVESKGNPLALNVNRMAKQPAKATSIAEAAATARRYIALGYSVDLGLSQINSKNLPALGLTVESVLDPCTNLRAADTILSAAYRSAGDLDRALSIYNTGSPAKGFWNGYVAKYYAGGVRVAAATPEAITAPSATPADDGMSGYFTQVEFALR